MVAFQGPTVMFYVFLSGVPMGWFLEVLCSVKVAFSVASVLSLWNGMAGRGVSLSFGEYGPVVLSRSLLV